MLTCTEVRMPRRTWSFSFWIGKMLEKPQKVTKTTLSQDQMMEGIEPSYKNMFKLAFSTWWVSFFHRILKSWTKARFVDHLCGTNRKSLTWMGLPRTAMSFKFVLTGWPISLIPIPPSPRFQVDKLTKQLWELLSGLLDSDDLKLVPWANGMYPPQFLQLCWLLWCD